MWTQESFSFEGRYYQVQEASSPIRPVQQPYPALFAASRTEKGKELLAREAGWWFPGYSYDLRDWRANVDRVAAQIDELRERAARYGRQLRFGISVQVLCEPTDLQALAAAEALEAHGKKDRVAAIAANRLGLGLFGTPATVAERTSLYVDKGIDMFLMMVSPMLEGIELFAAEVIPLLGPEIHALPEDRGPGR